LEKGGVEVPENLQNAKILTGYAVETRYPGDYEPVDEEDLRKAIEIAKEVLKWVNWRGNGWRQNLHSARRYYKLSL
jgi:HEPN domain-containing protein